SIPASASQPMTDAAYPVATRPAVAAHSRVSAVTTSRAAVMGKASAKVSAIGTSLTVSKRWASDRSDRSYESYTAYKTYQRPCPSQSSFHPLHMYRGVFVEERQPHVDADARRGIAVGVRALRQRKSLVYDLRVFLHGDGD